MFGVTCASLMIPFAFGDGPVDLDQDGQPDDWEREKFGTIFATDGTMDVDGDGLTGTEEFILGTEPLIEDTDSDRLLDGEDPAPLVVDYDSDGLTDYEEVTNFLTRWDSPDSDGGGRSDGLEIRVDETDPNNRADDIVDSDYDGMSNAAERAFAVCSGENCEPLNVYIPDSDGDGLCDGPPRAFFCGEDAECPAGFEHASDFDTCQLGEDLDNDGFYDAPTESERCVGLGQAYETDPRRSDTDGDGIPDGDEIGVSNPHCVDTDGEGLTDAEEFSFMAELETGCLDPAEPDSDSDYLSDLEELRGSLELNFEGSNPCLTDSDGDGRFDFSEVYEGTSPTDSSDFGFDTDGDGITDALEVAEGPLLLDRFPWSGPYMTTCADTDGDGLLDGEELFVYKSDPKDLDSDDDGVWDGDEVQQHQTDPTLLDTDQDGLTDGTELGYLEATQQALQLAYFPYDCDGNGIISLVETQIKGTDFAVFVEDADPLTTTDPLSVDSDQDGACDGPLIMSSCRAAEDGSGDGKVDPGEGNPEVPDTDGDGLVDGWELAIPDGLDCDEGISLGQVDVADNDLDQDGDGLTQEIEYQLGTSQCRSDTDGDGLCDGPGGTAENCVGSEDQNSNGAWDEGSETNPSEIDTDQDGLSDADEFELCTDSLNPDTDGDGLCDGLGTLNCQRGSERGYLTDPCNEDTDGDGISDSTEIFGVNRSNPLLVDTDGDGLCDGPIDAVVGPDCSGGEDLNADGNRDENETHPNLVDSDYDGLDDGFEDINRNGEVDVGETNPRLADSDGDGLTDGCYDSLSTVGACEDFNNDGRVDLDDGETDPLNPDSDGDGISDGDESFVFDTDPNDPFSSSQIDTDSDGIPDDREVELDMNPNSPDSDGDGISDRVEIGTDWTQPVDTDGDGMIDALDLDSDNDELGDQQELGSNPENPRDSDGDGVEDFRQADSDGGGVTDGVEVNRHQTDPTNSQDDGRGTLEEGAAASGMGCNGAASQPMWWVFLVALMSARRFRRRLGA